MPRAKEIPAPRTKKANRIQKFNAFDAVLLILLTLLGLMIVYPFYNTILVSLVPQADYTRNPFMLWPERITAHNRLLKRLADGERVVWHDLGAKFLRADGSLNDALYWDRLHPREAGYEVWADEILALLDG